jgi:hypothetical protein
VGKLQDKLAGLRAEMEIEESFKSFYGYCFDYAKEKDQKFLPPDIAIFLWELIVKDEKYGHTEAWCRFLQVPFFLALACAGFPPRLDLNSSLYSFRITHKIIFPETRGT